MTEIEMLLRQIRDIGGGEVVRIKRPLPNGAHDWLVAVVLDGGYGDEDIQEMVEFHQVHVTAATEELAP